MPPAGGKGRPKRPKSKKLRMETMKVTLSVIKADVGSIGGHTRPSEAMV
jgi:hypothetical protein